MKQQIPIFFACDDNYIPFLGTAIHTMHMNASKKYDYRVIILSNGIKEANKQRILNMAHDNLSIEFFHISDLIDNYRDLLKYRLRDYYSVAIYYRMFIPGLFPDLEKAIYLDADIIVLGDISELYNVELENNLVAAINDRLVANTPIFVDYVENVVGVPANEYFNSGVLVMNLNKFRSEQIEQKFLHLLNTYNFDTVAPDQDYLNVLCKSDKLLLPVNWNKMPVADSEFGAENLKLVHFNSFEKPWHHDNVLFGDEFWQSAVGSPFYEDLKAIKENYNIEQHLKRSSSAQSLLDKAAKITNEETITFKKILAY